tara:strand:- start:241 stop:405 length:165 start_codon:yes stop_codon:yes gene_type:complete
MRYYFDLLKAEGPEALTFILDLKLDKREEGNYEDEEELDFEIIALEMLLQTNKG